MIRCLQFLLLSMLFACAIESMPTGGEKDTVPPEVLNSSPENYGTHFEATTIKLTFDEYIELKNFNQQFSVSPPLQNKVDYNLKGKTLEITLQDTLKENTTYTLNFGNSIVDISEGNAQTNYKYVFSTGPVLDSLKVAGNIHHALSGKPLAGLLAMLYLESDEDSIGYKEKPEYYAVTKEDGSFSIENIKDANYRLLVLDDSDFNFKITSKKELRGFETGLIDPKIDSTYAIRAFIEKSALAFNSVKQIGQGLAEIYYSANVPEDFSVTELNTNPVFVDDRKGKDTLKLFFEKGISDTSIFYASYENQTDTLFIRNAEFEPVKTSLSAKKSTITPSDFLTLTCNKPIEAIDATNLLFVKNNDTITAPALTLDSNGFDIIFNEQPAFGDQYKLHYFPGFITAFHNTTVDTSSTSFSTKKETDYAFHIISLTQKPGQHCIVQLMDEKKNVVFEKQTIGKTTIEVPYLEPAGYVLRVILDEDENGVWDTGNYLKHIQPEKVLYYPNPIELRANWEIETIWDLY